jgi:PucR C-terminal helix-turn-helix domain
LLFTTCGCGAAIAKRPHIAIVWRAAALPHSAAQGDARTELWSIAVLVLADALCALRYDVGRVVGLVPEIPNAPLADRINCWHEQISARVGLVSGGRSSSHTGRAGLSQAIQEAMCALEVGDRTRGPGHLTAYADIFVLDYAARLVNDPRLSELYERVPSRLRTFDQAEGAELLPTLEVFLAEGSIQGAASQLQVHRNTVLYRLKRIGQITKIDLDEPDTRFLVQLALRAQRSIARESA